MTPIIFREECFDVEIHLLVPVESAELKTYIHNVTGDDYDPGDYRGLCFHTCGKTIIAIELPWNGEVREIATLSHECVHAANQILDAKGVPHSDHTEEVFAYLQESIFRRCLIALEERAAIKRPAPPPPAQWIPSAGMTVQTDDAPF